jgi:hypothetical protein
MGDISLVNPKVLTKLKQEFSENGVCEVKLQNVVYAIYIIPLYNGPMQVFLVIEFIRLLLCSYPVPWCEGKVFCSSRLKKKKP